MIGVLFAVPVFIIGRSIASPLAALAEAAREGDDFVPGSADGGEIGDIARAFHVLKSDLAEMEILGAEMRDSQERRNIGDIAARRAMAEDLRVGVGAAAETVVSASADIEIGARALLDGAWETTRRAASISETARQAADAGDAAAATAEGLAGSIGAIGQRVARSAEIAGQAVADAEGASQKVQGLADAVYKIDAVVTLITEIAHHTHLLALNATIEAARAGAAGKGFAVVASEVKTLATQTATATKEITSHIGDIQAATQSAVEAIHGFGGTIGDLNGLTADIAAAVAEEGEASRDIERGAREAASGTAEVTPPPSPWPKRRRSRAAVSNGSRRRRAPSSGTLNRHARSSNNWRGRCGINAWPRRARRPPPAGPFPPATQGKRRRPSRRKRNHPPRRHGPGPPPCRRRRRR